MSQDGCVQASDAVVQMAGGANAGALNHYSVGGNTRVATQQVDDWVFVIGQDDYGLARYTLDEWLGDAAQVDPEVIDCFDAEGAWELLLHLRDTCLVWQCGGCSGWIFTKDRPQVGVLRCSTCGDAGVDFRHADRHSGADG